MTFNLATLNDSYKRYHSATIEDDLDKDEKGQLTLEMIQLRDGLTQFIRDSKDKCNDITRKTSPRTIYRNKHGANHKWKMTFCWGEAKTNPIIHCQLKLNGKNLFENFYLQKCTTYNAQLNLTIHWSSALRSPQSLEEYDILIWGGQITMSCLNDFFTTQFPCEEQETLRLKGFNYLPIKTISKSFALFEKECIDLEDLPKKNKGGKAKQDFVRSFFQDLGFVYRGHQGDYAFNIEI